MCAAQCGSKEQSEADAVLFFAPVCQVSSGPVQNALIGEACASQALVTGAGDEIQHSAWWSSLQGLH